MKQNKVSGFNKGNSEAGFKHLWWKGHFSNVVVFIWNVEHWSPRRTTLQSDLQKHKRNMVVFRCLKHINHLHWTDLDSGVGHQIERTLSQRLWDQASNSGTVCTVASFTHLDSIHMNVSSFGCSHISSDIVAVGFNIITH